jgi:hypothetical protein
MDHQKYRNWIEMDIKNELSVEEKEEFLKHLELCESCRMKLDEKKRINKSAASPVELDRKKVEADKDKEKLKIENEPMKNPKKRWNFWKIALIISASIIFIITVFVFIISLLYGFAGGGSPVSNNEALNEYDQKITSDSSSTSSTVASSLQLDATKIIYSGNISLYTEDYQKTFNEIGEFAVAQGGFVQSSSSNYADQAENVETNSGYLTIRVPSTKFNESMKEIETYGTVISSSINSTNIAQEYQDIKGQLDNLKIEEARLQGYLNQAASLGDLLQIESELNRVRTEIDKRTTLIKNWDTEIAYSTIYISVYEKVLGTSTIESPFSGFVQKITEGFTASINFLLKIMAALILLVVRLIPFAAILGIGYLIYRKVRQLKKKKNQ